MRKCFLSEPCLDDEKAIAELVKSWREFGGRMNPGLLRRFDGDFAGWLKMLYNCKNGIGIGDEVPQTLYLLKDSEGNILGAVAIRHYLNHTNILDGGHVGYGICPEHRGKGYGNLILNFALHKLAEMGEKRILVTCDCDNEASRRVIVKNGGVLENRTLDEDGVPIERYWIDAGI